MDLIKEGYIVLKY